MGNYNHVLQRMAEDIQLRGLSPKTQNIYISYVRTFLEFCDLPVEELCEPNIRGFLLHLADQKNLSPKTTNVYSASIRFLFAVTLNRSLNYLQIPRQKEHKTLPEVLSREEVCSILENCWNIKYRAMLMLIYSSGLRISEALTLKIHNIDSKNMRVFVHAGKGGKDRYTLLSQTCLHELRVYWKACRPNHPEKWLFPGARNSPLIHPSVLRRAFQKAAQSANITKKVSVHTLRHSFATHLLEDGASILQIKDLLGHSSIKSTTIYLHLANVTAGIISPLDTFPAGIYPENHSHA